MKKLSMIIILFGVSIFLGCKQITATPTKSSQTNLIKPGDIVAINGTSRSLVLLDSNGSYKTVLYDLDNIGESIYGIEFKNDSKEIIFTINGSPRVGAISVVDGTYRTLISNTNLTGVLKGVAQLKGGDILVAEAATIERFDTNGVRKLSAAGSVWPISLGITSAEQIHATADGGFIICSSGSDIVKKYTSNTVVVGPSVVSGIAGTTDAIGCIELADGKIAIAFSGTTDTISTVSAAMTGVTALYSDLGLLASPRTLSQTLNGNILVADSVFNHIIEITTAGLYVRTIGGAILGNPNAAFSVPNY